VAKFRKKTTIIEAICITQPMIIKGSTGIMRGKPGDWLITSQAGEEYFVTERAFQMNYEPLDENAENYLKEVHERAKFGF